MEDEEEEGRTEEQLVEGDVYRKYDEYEEEDEDAEDGPEMMQVDDDDDDHVNEDDGDDGDDGDDYGHSSGNGHGIVHDGGDLPVYNSDDDGVN